MVRSESYMFQEAASYSTHLWPLLDDSCLQLEQEALLEAVDLLDVPKEVVHDLLRKHLRSVAGLADVTLTLTKRKEWKETESWSCLLGGRVNS